MCERLGELLRLPSYFTAHLLRTKFEGLRPDMRGDVMKKLLATVAIAATLATGTVAQAEAPELVPQMSTQTIYDDVETRTHHLIVPILAMILFIFAASGSTGNGYMPQ